jgi:Lipocalin-like domain
MAAGPIEGTWQLISGTIVENGDTTVTDYTRDQRMIKIINATHFSFLNHDLSKGKDSSAVFAAGGGRYTLSGDQYTEHLEYCSYREWEGNTFPFTLTIQGDTLTQRGVEKIENLGVERLNIEKYKRITGL